MIENQQIGLFIADSKSISFHLSQK